MSGEYPVPEWAKNLEGNVLFNSAVARGALPHGLLFKESAEEFLKIKKADIQAEVSIGNTAEINPSMKPETSASQKKKENDCSNFIHGSITGSPLIFEAFRRVYQEEHNESDVPKETFQLCAQLLLENVVNGYMEIGPQHVRTAVAEQNLTARFAMLLQHFYSTMLTEKSLVPSVEVGHQNKVEGQFMDVTMYHATPKGPHPRVIFEFSVCDANKQYQLHAYVSNCDAMLPKSLHLIALGVVVVLSPGEGASTISLYGHYKVLVKNTSNHEVAKVSSVLLFTGLWTVDVLTRVLRVCDWFVKLPMSSFELPVTGVPHEKWPTVLMSRDGNTVFKAYDYRRFPRAGSRNPTLAIEYLPDCRNVFCGSDLNSKCTVIEYPKIVGDHAPPNNKSAMGVIDCLRRMHEDGNLHMDIKAGNCVFNGTDHSKSALIDFDLSRPIQSATYPSNYVLDITDGRRHSDVKPDGRGLKVHDTYALAVVLRFSRAGTEELQVQWDRVCELVELGQLADATKLLSDQDEFQLELRPDSALWSTTGSPQK